MRRALLFSLILMSIGAIVQGEPLTQKTVIRMTRETSATGQSLLLQNEIAEQNLQKALSQYDTTLSAYTNYTDDESARASIIYGSKSTMTNFGLGVTQIAPTGTQFNLGFDNWRQTSDSAFISSNELFESKLSLNITQPLLKNFFGIGTRGTVNTARKQTDAAFNQNAAEILDLQFANVTLYWNWHYALQAQKLADESVTLAHRLYANNAQKNKVGLIEASDLAAFSANLNIKKAEQLNTQMQVESLTSELRSKLSLSETPTPGVETFSEPKLPPIEDAQKMVLSQNPGLLALRDSLSAQNIAFAVAKNNALPRLDLQGSLALNGIDSSYSGAAEDVNEPHPAWTIGVALNFPLQNRIARSEKKLSSLRKQQLLYQLQNAEDTLVNSTKATHKNYQALLQKTRLLAAAVEAQRQKWEGTELKYSQGRSDTDQILSNQNDYLQARALYLRAKVDLQIEYAKLCWLMGRFEE